MAYRLEFHPSAEAELEEAVSWYQNSNLVKSRNSLMNIWRLSAASKKTLSSFRRYLKISVEQPSTDFLILFFS